MKKLAALFISLLLIVGLNGCVRLPSGSVQPEIQPAYFASVAIVDKNNKASGAGTIVLNKKGYQLAVLTAAHVVKGMQKRGVKKIYALPSYSRTKVLMRVSKIDVENDLALLLGFPKEKRDGPYVRLASRTPNIGETVWAIGSPMGVKWTVGKGILSNFEVVKGKMFYRITADMFFGNSGGGLFNQNNELVGVVNSIQVIQIGLSIIVVPGANYAVPLKSIRKFL
jgi:S1-C subfamily serine protease